MENRNEHEIKSRREQYVIAVHRDDPSKMQSGEMSLLMEILDMFGQSGEFDLVHALGTIEEPTGFVVEMSPKGHEELAVKYGDRLLIDPDIELKMFSMEEDIAAEFAVPDFTGVIPAAETMSCSTSLSTRKFCPKPFLALMADWRSSFLACVRSGSVVG